MYMYVVRSIIPKQYMHVANQIDKFHAVMYIHRKAANDVWSVLIYVSTHLHCL